ncbi:MAG: cysteine--tRNA ligase [Clostridia bacterium]|jgi:cysteinyl-tRNA synthetase|nr:cysteine--tRNA ligase [Clostridia bacterium]
MLKVYNTYSREKEEFKIDGDTVRMYTCGPTVYNYAHIGNLRAYIFMDTLRKVLKYNGYKLLHVMNITDVGHMTSDADEGEDKMLKASREKHMKPEDIANMYTEVFLKDIEKLNIERPEYIAKATDHIKEMEEYVEDIVENGYGYETSKGVYFDTDKLSTYGELSKVNLKDQKAGARVEVDDEKKSPLDFALWIKAPQEHIMKWNSKWGMCYPGWHIECSAMSRKYLGEFFDIHTGGVDHIQIHHENEIAQSRGATGKNPAKYWMHSEFLLIDGGKMSKSLGNVYTIDDIENKGFEPIAYRYLAYTSHYRNKLNFTWDAIESANNSLSNIRKLYQEHLNGNEEANDINKFKEKFVEAINDDLNMPMAMAVVWEVLRSNKSKEYAKLLLEFDEVLSLNIDKIAQLDELEIPLQVLEIVEERKKARESKDFTLSDTLRDKLYNMGYKVLDTKEGQKIDKI